MSCLAKLLREAPARALFTRAGGPALLAPLLKGASGGSSSSAQQAPSHQLLYEAGLCAWQLTFYPPAAQAMVGVGIVPALVDVVRHAAKEKVRSAAVATLRCLCSWRCCLR
jgi:V-type H+-transporting ATPase subunit H